MQRSRFTRSLLCLPFAAAGLAHSSAWGREASIAGQTYVTAATVATRYGMTLRTVVTNQSIRLESQWSRLEFTLHKRDFLYNGIKHHLGFPIALNSNGLWIAKSDVDYTLDALLTPQRTNPKPRLYRILIDPGHGGKDTGAINKTLNIAEKTLALDVSLRLRGKLRSLGYDVHLTRETDVFLPLEDRAAHANRIKADLFLSIHFNSTTTTSVRGIETFTLAPLGQPSTAAARPSSSDRTQHPGHPFNTWSTQAGSLIQGGLVSSFSGEPDRGLKRARFQVLRSTAAPSALLELGFISNLTSARQIANASYRERLAESVKTGVFEYQKKLNQVRGR